MLNESIPTASASTASSPVLRMTASPRSSRPDSSTLMGTNESNPNSMSWRLVIFDSSRLKPGSSIGSQYLQIQIRPTDQLLHMQVPAGLSSAGALSGDLLEPVPRRRRGSGRTRDQLHDARVRRRLLSARGGTDASPYEPALGAFGQHLESRVVRRPVERRVVLEVDRNELRIVDR